MSTKGHIRPHIPNRACTNAQYNTALSVLFIISGPALFPDENSTYFYRLMFSRNPNKLEPQMKEANELRKHGANTGTVLLFEPSVTQLKNRYRLLPVHF